MSKRRYEVQVTAISYTESDRLCSPCGFYSSEGVPEVVEAGFTPADPDRPLALCLTDGDAFLGTAATGWSTYSNFLESRVNVTGP